MKVMTSSTYSICYNADDYQVSNMLGVIKYKKSMISFIISQYTIKCSVHDRANDMKWVLNCCLMSFRLSINEAIIGIKVLCVICCSLHTYGHI